MTCFIKNLLTELILSSVPQGLCLVLKITPSVFTSRNAFFLHLSTSDFEKLLYLDFINFRNFVFNI